MELKENWLTLSIPETNQQLKINLQYLEIL